MATYADVFANIVGKDYVKLITMATTGLDAAKDAVLCMCTRIVYFDGRYMEPYKIFQAVDRDVALKGVEFHRIPSELISNEGLSKPDFTDALTNSLEGEVVLTYNTDFHSKFLLCTGVPEHALTGLVNLPALLKFAEMQLPVQDEDLATVRSLDNAAKREVGKACPAFKRMCDMRGLRITDAPGDLPLEQNIYLLSGLFDLLMKLPVLVL